MRLPLCIYLSDDTKAALGQLYDELRKLSEGNIDGFNMNPSYFGPSFYTYPAGNLNNPDNTQPPTIQNYLWPVPGPNPPPNPPPPPWGPGGGPGFYPKTGSDGSLKGMEVGVIASDGTNGRFCVVDANDTNTVDGVPSPRQLISLIPDQSTNTNPGGTIKTPVGAMTLDTGGAFDTIFKRNASEGLRLDGTGLLASKQLRWNTGLGAISQLYGPTDQNFQIEAPNNKTLELVAGATGNVLFNVNGTTMNVTSSLVRLAVGLTWYTGLGAIDHIIGPTDQPLSIIGGTGQNLKLSGASGHIISPQTQIQWPTGLGAIIHHLGPTDQDYIVQAPTGRALKLKGNAGTGGTITGGADGSVTIDTTGQDAPITLKASGTSPGFVDFHYASVAADTNVPTFIHTPTGVAAAQSAWLPIQVNGATKYIMIWG